MKERVLTYDKISSFAIYLKNEEKSKNTIEKYIRDVKLFSLMWKVLKSQKKKLLPIKTNWYAITMPYAVLIQCLRQLTAYLSKLRLFSKMHKMICDKLELFIIE